MTRRLVQSSTAHPNVQAYLRRNKAAKQMKTLSLIALTVLHTVCAERLSSSTIKTYKQIQAEISQSASHLPNNSPHVEPKSNLATEYSKHHINSGSISSGGQISNAIGAGSYGMNAEDKNSRIFADFYPITASQQQSASRNMDAKHLQDTQKILDKIRQNMGNNIVKDYDAYADASDSMSGTYGYSGYENPSSLGYGLPGYSYGGTLASIRPYGTSSLSGSLGVLDSTTGPSGYGYGGAGPTLPQSAVYGGSAGVGYPPSGYSYGGYSASPGSYGLSGQPGSADFSGGLSSGAMPSSGSGYWPQIPVYAGLPSVSYGTNGNSYGTSSGSGPSHINSISPSYSYAGPPGLASPYSGSRVGKSSGSLSAEYGATAPGSSTSGQKGSGPKASSNAATKGSSGSAFGMSGVTKPNPNSGSVPVYNSSSSISTPTAISTSTPSSTSSNKKSTSAGLPAESPSRSLMLMLQIINFLLLMNYV